MSSWCCAADFLDQIAAVEPVDDAPLADPDDIAILLFTSGTTGEPKAAVLRHRHLASYVIGTVEFMGADEDEAALVSVPPYHIAGISAVRHRCLRRPAACATCRPSTPEAWVAAGARRGGHPGDGRAHDARAASST